MTRPLALLSVHDKTGLIDFAQGLIALGMDLLASGGTARALTEAELPVLEVADLTGFPELLGGRVKTLHPAVHAGILSRRTDADTRELDHHGLRPIALVAVSLYPFEEALLTLPRNSTISTSEINPALIEHIDIGGVALLRAAAKNHAHVLVVPGPSHYGQALEALRNSDAEARLRLAAKAFALTASYDAMIARALTPASLADAFPGHRPSEDLRYGENPHQQAVFLTPSGSSAPYHQRSGKALSYNNLLDLDATLSALADFAAPACVIVKHGSPCGIAMATDATPLATVIARAIAADPVSAFGGILAVNRRVSLADIDALGDLFLEVFAAPAFDDDASDRLARHRKNCRVLTFEVPPPTMTARSVLGGLLVQTPDLAKPEPDTWEFSNTNIDLDLARFAWSAVKHVKSNAIVLARRDGELCVTVGIGGGQTNRIDAVHQALARAGTMSHGATLASDAFFPFSDGVEAAAQAGVSLVLEPGGAMRDAEVKNAAERLGLTLVLTHRRHFRH
jgi:phosphoribosylaminoimidazolecarboxamide formyltransferase/IMP cyclohydrolase